MFARDQFSILIVDDEVRLLRALEKILRSRGYRVTTLADPTQALAYAEDGNIAVALIDICLHHDDIDGFGLLVALKQINPAIEVILMTGHGSIPLAVDAMKAGAADFLTKPVND